MNIAANPSYQSVDSLDNIEISYYRGLSDRSVSAWILNPLIHSDEPPLVMVHGINRDVEGIAHAMSGAAAAAGRTVVLPHFDIVSHRRYQLCINKNRSDLALLSLLESLRLDQVINSDKFDIAGFSGGAQFAHRFTWLYPHLVRGLQVSSAGWYTFPDSNPFPYGLGRTSANTVGPALCMEYNLRRFLDRHIMIRVGELDNVVDPTTRSGEVVDIQQGKDRLSRAEKWAEALDRACRKLDLTPRIHFSILPRCGHNIFQCIEAAGLDALLLNGSESDSKENIQ